MLARSLRGVPVNIGAPSVNVAPDLSMLGSRSCSGAFGNQNSLDRMSAFGDLPQESARSIFSSMQEFTVRPQPDDPRLTRSVAGIDHEGHAIETAVVMERPLTLFLNGR